MERFKNIIPFVAALCILILAGNVVLKKIYPLGYIDVIKEHANDYNIDPLFVVYVIRVESRFAADATSHKNSKGLMQIKDETALWCAQRSGLEDFTPEKIYYPEINIRLGVCYLNYLLDEFDGNYNLCLAAYNAGMGNVKKWLANSDYSDDGINLKEIPFPETQKYIKKVLNNYTVYKMLYGKKV